MAAPQLEDLKKHLGITASTDDAEMQGVLAAAIGLVEESVGPLAGTSTVEVHTTTGPELVLGQSPVEEITSITRGAAIVPADEFALNQRAGIVRLLGGRQFQGEYVVTYEAGWNSPPAEIRTAVLLIAAQLWETQRVPGRRPGFGQNEAAVPAGFAVPKRAAELMAPHRKGYLP